ncbi:MATE family efflux transporter [Alloscardovia macacae]|uniref:MATE family efflux transporter n=1 Tax=Alloscardovia macacae TaxID=1160091 RepID=A0A261F6M8_9BIFI|nr:MATE family efflux transporter [Alloscardovia macacae]OZG54809.1 MATE family efflux transporter [Alloscardovia macacae]
MPATSPKAVRRQLAAIAIPTLGQLIAEPLYVMADTAFVGSISDIALAGLSVGSTLVLTSVGLCLFLAYSTTSRVSQLMGAKRTREGLKAGVAGVWLAAIIGIVLTAALVLLAQPLSLALGARGAVLDAAVIYVQTASLGITGTLISYAANGMFRGLGKAGITLWSAVASALTNVVLDAWFIFGFGWGVMGSGVATAIAQWVMCFILLAYLGPVLRRNSVSVRPDLHGVLASAENGVMLFVRTAAVRVGMVATVMAATALGTSVLASYQAVNSSWNLALNILDAIGVGGQALVGVALGAGDMHRARMLVREIERAGIVWGAYVGLGFAAFGWFGAGLFTTQAATAQLIAVSMVVVALFFPYHGWLWALDGVLIGAGDFSYLARACVLAASVHVAALALAWWTLSATGASPLMSVVTLWLVFNLVFMGIRGMGNILRAHGDVWMAAALASSRRTEV